MANLYRVDIHSNDYAPESTDAIVSMPSFKLVRAKSKAQAIAHVAHDLLSARLAVFEDGREAAALNISVEDAEASE